MRASHRRRWQIAWLLGFGVLVNYFDRVNLSVSQAALTTSFGISDVAFGYLSGAYNWTYAACQLPVGVLLDRFGVRRVGRASILLWSLASFAAALTPGLAGFFGARFLLGVGEAPTFPANAKAIGAWFPAEERSFATSLFDAAAKFASAIGVPLLGILLLHVGWRWSFAATGFLSLLYLSLFWSIYHDPAYGCAREGPAQQEASSLSLASLLRQPKVLGFALGFGSYNYVFYLLLTWLPSYLSRALHIDLLHSFLYTGAPWLVATATDLAIGGWLVDALIARGWDAGRVRKCVLVGGTACGLGILGSARRTHALRSKPWHGSASPSAGSPQQPRLGGPYPPSSLPARVSGESAASSTYRNQLSGIAAPIVTGYVVHATHSFAWAFGVAAIYLTIGIAAYLLLLGRIEPLEDVSRSAA